MLLRKEGLSVYFGVDYYPEHWPEERWKTDAKLMKEAGFNVVRLAEFAWAKLEPIEGNFDFRWLDQVINIFDQLGIKVVLGTPTASMPRWVSLKYPETVAVKKSGEKIPYGARKDNCPSSQAYRLLGQKITKAMAKHYTDNTAVIGWQIDNELGGPDCYCQTCRAAWQDWLHKRFSNIENLNRRWGTIFWGHTYRTWNEIPIPKRGWDNPSMALDFARFHSDLVVSFQKEQVEIIRGICSQHFITHNLMGFFDKLDYYDLAKDLDFVSWDFYYNFRRSHEARMLEYSEGAAAHDLMRSLKQKQFWIMETTAGPTGNKVFKRNVRPGEIRRLSYQSVAHGANGLVWFRWRTCRFGFEQYWHGLLGHDGLVNKRYKEVSKTTHELVDIQAEIELSEVKPDVGIVFSYDDRWCFNIQPHSERFDYVQHLMQYYKAVVGEGLNIGFINLNQADLSQYKLVIAPTLHIITPELATKLENYVANGGVLVLTFRSGVKDPDNVCYDLTLPGHLRQMTGIRVEEYEGLSDGTSYKVSVNHNLGWGEFSCGVLADWIIPETARVIASYQEHGLENYAALTENKYGRGKVYYVGTWFEEELYNHFINYVIKGLDLQPLVKPITGVEVSTRCKGDIIYIFVLNHNDAEVKLDMPTGLELLSGQKVENSLRVAAGDVAIVKVVLSENEGENLYENTNN